MLEDIVKQIRAVLQNQLPGKLDQIELERADGVTLDDIQYFYLQGGHKDGRHNYPNIIILGEAATCTNATLPPYPKRELRHRVSIWVADRVVSPDSELAQTRLLRYVEAVERVLALNPTLGGKAIDSTVANHDYYFKREDFVKRALLTLNVLERPSTASY
ncbi:MAG: hypothetical protein HY715_08505 [Planctomycetes bacterium]|nr:hypothetical protein [Planctomycetota bacterium]